MNRTTDGGNQSKPVLVAVYFAGAIAWSIFHLVSYLWATVACSVPERLLIVFTAATTSAVTLGAILYGRRTLHSLPGQSQQPANRNDSDGTRLIALCGLYLNIFFLASIGLTSLAVAFLRACE